MNFTRFFGTAFLTEHLRMTVFGRAFLCFSCRLYLAKKGLKILQSWKQFNNDLIFFLRRTKYKGLGSGTGVATEVFYKKCILKIFPKFTGKHLCQSHFLKRD